MTRSALTKTFGGIVRPICFAALRLIMNTNFSPSQTKNPIRNPVHFFAMYFTSGMLWKSESWLHKVAP
jgi:hypothetical protein